MDEQRELLIKLAKLRSDLKVSYVEKFGLDKVIKVLRKKVVPQAELNKMKKLYADFEAKAKDKKE
jgi:hypothetical protein